MTRVGKLLRDNRHANELKLRDVASALGISAAYLSDIESGNTKGSPGVLQRIAHHVGVSTPYLRDAYAYDAMKRALDEWDEANEQG